MMRSFDQRSLEVGPALVVFVNVQKPLRRRLVGMGVEFGDNMPRYIDRRPHEPQCFAIVLLAATSRGPAPGLPVAAVGLQRGDEVAFRVPLDPGAVSSTSNADAAVLTREV